MLKIFPLMSGEYIYDYLIISVIFTILSCIFPGFVAAVVSFTLYIRKVVGGCLLPWHVFCAKMFSNFECVSKQLEMPLNV